MLIGYHDMILLVFCFCCTGSVLHTISYHDIWRESAQSYCLWIHRGAPEDSAK